MADEPEVIERELEETRADLAKKLEEIGTKISGTMDTVTETVANVTETVSNVTNAVEGTVETVAETVSDSVEAVKDTVSAVGEKASETVQAVKEAFNLPEQVRRHPWGWFAGSVVLGFVGGKILGPRRSHTWKADSFARGRGYYEEPELFPTPPPERRSEPEPERGREEPSEAKTTGGVSSLLGNAVHTFSPEINKLKELALGSLFGVVRDMVVGGLPESLKDQVQHLINDFTEKVGGKPIKGHVLGEENQEQEHEESSQQGQQSAAPEGNGPAGSSEKKTKAGASK
jgi:ElaB/YqjD/DUF883 family membrane-anchored ribosome-binding protein